MIKTAPRTFLVSPAIIFCLILTVAQLAAAQGAKFEREVRARELGVPFEGTPGPLNSITDVKGVEVGYRTLISGDGKLIVGTGPVRTGVTAVFPRGKNSVDPVFAGWFTENGNGEMTGTTWVEESGFLYGPVMITNTHSVGVVRDAVIAWQLKHGTSLPLEDWWSLPVVAETWDGYLNDINGFHVKAEDADAAMRDAHSGPIAEGNVGGGTGMICFEFKGGTGTASRQLPEKLGGYTVGVLVQCNFGVRHLLRVAGTPVGYEITGQSGMGRRYGLDHRGGGDRRATAAEPDEAHREARDAGPGALGQHFRQRFRGYFYRVFHGECGRGLGAEKTRGCADVAERADGRAF